MLKYKHTFLQVVLKMNLFKLISFFSFLFQKRLSGDNQLKRTDILPISVFIQA